MVNNAANRRIGSRVTVELTVTLQAAPKQKGLRRSNGRAAKARITNLSVTGAEVECSGIDGLNVRDKAILTGAEGRAVVEIRRVTRVDRRHVVYGVLFDDIDPAFATALNRATSGDDSEDLDWRWASAR